MKLHLPVIAMGILGALVVHAQNVVEEPTPDPVLDAIHDFNTRDKSKPAEISVVLEPEAANSISAESKQGPSSPVPGKPPEPSNQTQEPADKDSVAISPDEQSPKPENGLAVRVEKLHVGKGTIDPSKVKLLAPFPAKPLAQAPAGWRLDASETAPPFTREVELAPGSKITLNIRPHLLVPDADGAQVFSISEPGYDNALGYQQTATVGAILSNSIQRLDEESKQLGTAIDSLQQLLISLPKPESPPQGIEPVKPVILPVHKK